MIANINRFCGVNKDTSTRIQVRNCLLRSSWDSVPEGLAKQQALAHCRALILTSEDLSENLFKNSTKSARYLCARWHSGCKRSFPIKLTAFIRTST